jgi:peptidoglycan/LPS O-acetylase OafA/YrhL
MRPHAFSQRIEVARRHSFNGSRATVGRRSPMSNDSAQQAEIARDFPLERLRRLLAVPVRAGHARYLDGWRGVCILLVLAGHFAPAAGPLANVGVEFFFVLSGALMAKILVHERQDIRTFIWRRFSRVVPALATYVVLVGAALNISLWWQGQAPRVLSPVGALLFFHNYLPHADVTAVFEHTWSLAVEEHSYLLLVAIVLLARRRPALSAALAVTLSALAVANAYRLQGLPYDGGQFLFWRSDVRAASVLLSFAIAIFSRRAAWQFPSWSAPVMGLAALVCIFYQDTASPAEYFVGAILAGLAVNSLHSANSRLLEWLGSPVLVWFGTLSFSIYIWQQLPYVGRHFGLPVYIAVPMLLGCALLSFRLVENPGRDRLNAVRSKWSKMRIATCLPA